MKKNLWVFNIDNTLANTNEKIQERVDGFGTKLCPFPLPSGFFEDNPDVFLGAAPYSGSAEALRRLEETGSKVVYVTTRSPWFRNLTEHWLRMNGFPLGEAI
ncbi:hypothetical protein [Paenibacillus oryzisoli]|uniref:Uncharacterized protein n=1 Tax=Paenibacillus oryzisoli TaxID=1850517 RepID=A0A198AL77_9BACL|nr:hypothetical protein [Paenibacillus oryzisoli]OAS21825.1 hypothetical protein A8708_06715 [Paenibacillus oryzisoli]